MNPWIVNLLRSAGSGGGSAPPLIGRTLFAPLKSSLVLSEGTGSPTFTRATKAWRLNELGILQEVPSGCAVFDGARLVRNLCPTPSNTLAVAGTKTVTLTTSATLQFSMGAGAGTATFSGTGGATGTLNANASARVSINKAVGAGTFIVTASVADLVDLSIVDVTGYDASYVPEYVSVGVASSPFFGAGIDGAKYYETDWQGAPIPAASLLGFRREPAATNNLLQSRNLTVHNAGPITTKRWQSVTPVGAEIVLNSSFDSGLTNWTTTIGSGGSISVAGGQCTFVSDGGTGTYMTNAAVLTVGSTYVLETIATGTGSIKFANGAQEITGVGAGTNAISFVATSAAFQISRTAGVACNLVFDSISVKLSSVQCAQTATGLDGIANTATTLTATATDAIILQPITLSSAARCASAYVKRRTGTGTISFTQDGGSSWTDITSLINSSTYSRVQITSTLANPSVGFKISTSGDAIDVDVVQNEAGSVATSPIVTTTATVTRNADSLTYQTASNWSDTAGTAFVEVAPLAYSGGAIGSATNGLLLSTSNSGATAYDGTNSANGPSGTPGSSEKLAFRWGSGAMTVSSGGVIGTPGTYDGGMGLSSIGVGSSAAGCFRNAAIYNYAMTDAELQAVTA